MDEQPTMTSQAAAAEETAQAMASIRGGRIPAGDVGDLEHAVDAWDGVASTCLPEPAAVDGKAPQDISSSEATRVPEASGGGENESAGGSHQAKAQLVLNPTFAALTYINVYATKTRMYLVGCDQVSLQH